MSTNKPPRPLPLEEHVHGPDCDHEHHHHEALAAPHRREAPKVGRNDPCPCGSGQKFKKCHGRAEG